MFDDGSQEPTIGARGWLVLAGVAAAGYLAWAARRSRPHGAGAWMAMVHAIRNLGRPGICSMAIAAVDACLWDLKARLLDLPLVKLLGAARRGAAVYGSGGFTSYSVTQLQRQLGGWAAQGI